MCWDVECIHQLEGLIEPYVFTQYYVDLRLELGGH